MILKWRQLQPKYNQLSKIGKVSEKNNSQEWRCFLLNVSFSIIDTLMSGNI